MVYFVLTIRKKRIIISKFLIKYSIIRADGVTKGYLKS